MNKIKPIVKYIFVSGLILFFTLLLLEVLMIILEPYCFKGFYQYDPDLGFKVRAYANGTNRFGFNDRDYSLKKPENIIRILFLGDSFSWAGGKEGNYSALVEKKFEEYYGTHRVDIINAGYPMTHTGEQLAMLTKYGLKYNPDIVFLGFFAGNDFVDANPYRKRIVVNDTYFDIDPRDEIIFLGYPIIAKSRLLYFIKQKYKIWKELNKAHADTKNKKKQLREFKSKDSSCTFSEEAFLDIERARLEFCNIHLYKNEIFKNNIDYIFKSLYSMQKILTDHKIKLMVGIYPDEFQVNQELTLQIFEHYALNSKTYDIRLMQNILKDYLDDAYIAYLDLLEPFQTQGRKKALYLCRDTHWNQAGNELAARIIFEYLFSHVDEVISSH